MSNNVENTAVDFTNPEAVEAALAAANEQELTANTPAAPKVRKPAKPRVIKVTYVAEHDIKAGETIEFEYEVPKAERRGQVAGIALEDMTDDQLKIEYRNANSVHYKTVKAGRDATKAAERLERVKAEMEKRGIQPTARAAVSVTAESVAELIKAGKISVEELQKLLNA